MKKNYIISEIAVIEINKIYINLKTNSITKL